MFHAEVLDDAAAEIEGGRVEPLDAYARALAKQRARDPVAIDRRRELELRVLFYRTLYRFHLTRPDIRDIYLALVDRGRENSYLCQLVHACDLIDTGALDDAVAALEQRLDEYPDRWLKSALFQLVRIGAGSPAHADRCLPHALRLRGLLEGELERRGGRARLSKYVLCNLFVTSWYARAKLDPADIDSMIGRATRRMGDAIDAILEHERYWDAC